MDNYEQGAWYQLVMELTNTWKFSGSGKFNFQILKLLARDFKEWFSCYCNVLTRKGCSDGGHWLAYLWIDD